MELILFDPDDPKASTASEWMEEALRSISTHRVRWPAGDITRFDLLRATSVIVCGFDAARRLASLVGTIEPAGFFGVYAGDDPAKARSLLEPASLVTFESPGNPISARAIAIWATVRGWSHERRRPACVRGAFRAI